MHSDSGDEIFTTKPKTTEKAETFDRLTEPESRKPLLKYFKSANDLVERLRAIESENWYIIQLSQNTTDDKNVVERQIQRYRVN